MPQALTAKTAAKLQVAASRQTVARSQAATRLRILDTCKKGRISRPFLCLLFARRYPLTGAGMPISIWGTAPRTGEPSPAPSAVRAARRCPRVPNPCWRRFDRKIRLPDGHFSVHWALVAFSSRGLVKNPFIGRSRSSFPSVRASRSAENDVAMETLTHPPQDNVNIDRRGAPANLRSAQ